MFKRPIPGQSLTMEPKAMPYERPPEVVDPEQALQIHLFHLAKPDVMASALTLLEDGLDLVTVVEGLTRTGVAKGIHSVDVSLIVAPVIHEFIKTTADAVGIEYEEGFGDEEDKKTLRYRSKLNDARKQISKLDLKPKEVAEDVAPLMEEKEVVVEEKPSRGLMARM